MKMTHEFHPMHGFTGSAGINKRPSIPGYKKGGEVTGRHASAEGHMDHDDHPKNHGGMHEDEHGFHIHKGMKHGGKVKKKAHHHKD